MARGLIVAKLLQAILAAWVNLHSSCKTKRDFAWDAGRLLRTAKALVAVLLTVGKT
jgi:hypothetical protein